MGEPLVDTTMNAIKQDCYFVCGIKFEHCYVWSIPDPDHDHWSIIIQGSALVRPPEPVLKKVMGYFNQWR